MLDRVYAQNGLCRGFAPNKNVVLGQHVPAETRPSVFYKEAL